MFRRAMPWIMFAMLATFGLGGVLPYPMVDLVYPMTFIGIPFLVAYLLHRWRTPCRIGQLAVNSAMLTPREVEQIIFCQNDCGMRFGEIAIMRNYLQPDQVDTLLIQQQSSNQ